MDLLEVPARPGGLGDRGSFKKIKIPVMEIKFFGPLYFAGAKGPSIFFDEMGQQRGVYIWTIPYKAGGYIATYVGETGESFAKRMKTHMIQIMGGNYRFSDIHRMKMGEEAVLWNGTWRKGTRDKMGEFLKRLPEFAPKLQEYLHSVSIFVGPIETEKKIRQRIERGIGMAIRKSPEPFCSFYPKDNRYPGIKKGSEPFSFKASFPALIHGLGCEFIA